MAKGKKLTTRRLSREWALQFLFQLDLRDSNFEEEDLDLFWTQLTSSPAKPKQRDIEAGQEYTNELIRGVVAKKTELDDKLQSFSENWSIKRMGAVDRNLLRLGAYEILHTEVPAQVVLNEAVEIAKAFSEKDSPSFINAILDKVHKSSN